MEHFFNNPKTLMQMRQGLLAPYLPLFALHLREQGYAVSSGRIKIQLISDFGRWLKHKRITVPEITSAHAKQYLRFRARKLRPKSDDAPALKSFLELLRREGAATKQVLALPATSPLCQ